MDLLHCFDRNSRRGGHLPFRGGQPGPRGFKFQRGFKVNDNGKSGPSPAHSPCCIGLRYFSTESMTQLKKCFKNLLHVRFPHLNPGGVTSST